ncbi:MAG: ribosome recycling factor [Chitinivibrionia bacterium]|nr:ribosome recycling factor [Chitinivibrionia bacterium]
MKRMNDSMEKTLDNLRHELSGIRTGKANPALLDSIKVNYYGQPVPLKQVANISVPDPRLITIQPWDKSIVSEVEKAILASDLGLNPQSDGTLIRLPIPPLTEERRRDLVKVTKRMAEDSKVALRNVRRDSNERIKKLEKEHTISEDEMHGKQDDVQRITDAFIKKVDEIVHVKEKEIMEI